MRWPPRSTGAHTRILLIDGREGKRERASLSTEADTFKWIFLHPALAEQPPKEEGIVDEIAAARRRGS